MASVVVTEADLLEALATAQRGAAEGQTAVEMAEATGIAHKRVIMALRAMQKEGRLQVQYGKRLGIDGRLKPVPLYTILAKKKGAK